MIQTLSILHVIISVTLILLVLLQFGKGAEAGLMGGDSGGAVFTGSQSGNLLTRVTTVLSILFLGLSITLAVMRSKDARKSIFDDVAPEARPLNIDEKIEANKPDAKTSTAPAKKTENTTTDKN